MKNIRIITVIGVLLFTVLSWYMTINSKTEYSTGFNEGLLQARAYEEKNLCLKAIGEYEKVLAMEESLELRVNIYQLYRKAFENSEITSSIEVEDYLNSLVEKYKYEPLVYELAIQFYLENVDYETISTLFAQSHKREVTSEKLEKIKEEIRYKYQLKELGYDQVKPYLNNCYLYKKVDTYGYYTNISSLNFNNFDMLSPFSEGYSLCRKFGYTYLIDHTLIRETYFPEEIEESSGVGDGLLACKVGDTYKYYNLEGKVQFGDYEFAGKFKNGVAAVYQDEAWRLINTEGNYISETKYKDIKLNALDECVSDGVIFVKEKEMYQMMNLQMEKMNNLQIEDADFFINQYAAVKLGGKWGVISADGEIQMQPAFNKMKSFSGGLAGVKVGKKWGFINGKGEVVIEPQFEDVLYFTNGTCFVKGENGWNTITLYYRGE